MSAQQKIHDALQHLRVVQKMIDEAEKACANAAPGTKEHAFWGVLEAIDNRVSNAIIELGD